MAGYRIGMGNAIADKIIEQGPIAPAYNTYTVVRGDSLSLIAAKVLGSASRWQEIFQINPQISDPNEIEPGMVLNLPAGAVAVSTNPNKVMTPVHTALDLNQFVSPDEDTGGDPGSLPPPWYNTPQFLVGAFGLAVVGAILLTRKKTA